MFRARPQRRGVIVGEHDRRPYSAGELTFQGLRWRWEWLGGTGEVYSRMTQPMAHCPECGGVWRVASSWSRVVRRPAWPAIYTCECGFFKGFPLPPEDLVALAYREVNRRHGGVPAQRAGV